MEIWKEAKQQPGTAGPGNMLGCCLVSFHILWAILCPQAVGFLDRGLTLYVVQVRAKPVPRGQTAQSLTCFTMEKPHAVLEECLKILLSCFSARNSSEERARMANAQMRA